MTQHTPGLTTDSPIPISAAELRRAAIWTLVVHSVFIVSGAQWYYGHPSFTDSMEYTDLLFLPPIIGLIMGVPIILMTLPCPFSPRTQNDYFPHFSLVRSGVFGLGFLTLLIMFDILSLTMVPPLMLKTYWLLPILGISPYIVFFSSIKNHRENLAMEPVTPFPLPRPIVHRAGFIIGLFFVGLSILSIIGYYKNQPSATIVDYLQFAVLPKGLGFLMGLSVIGIVFPSAHTPSKFLGSFPKFFWVTGGAMIFWTLPSLLGLSLDAITAPYWMWFFNAATMTWIIYCLFFIAIWFGIRKY